VSINFVDQTNAPNHYTTPPPNVHDGRGCLGLQWGSSAHGHRGESHTLIYGNINNKQTLIN